MDGRRLRGVLVAPRDLLHLHPGERAAPEPGAPLQPVPGSRALGLRPLPLLGVQLQDAGRALEALEALQTPATPVSSAPTKSLPERVLDERGRPGTL